MGVLGRILALFRAIPGFQTDLGGRRNIWSTGNAAMVPFADEEYE